MVSDLSKKALQDLIPGISLYALDTARQHAVKHGKGVRLPKKEKFTRQRIDKGKLDHALDFFFGPTFHQTSSLQNFFLVLLQQTSDRPDGIFLVHELPDYGSSFHKTSFQSPLLVSP
ncbi:Hypothetical predicted protein [Mytilus galloprovincialis]|uniref:Uncharacterized protein n=1 Tax=Mytilus galloprovincialis TaxID=29158 RepID=A0A8B6EIY2_MYTGA|nr:Hypothetical predicted protein [Mytilus galloprovincialis]